MFENLKIFAMASQSATHAGARQAVVAENIAHSDTPGYRARDLPSFTSLWADRSGGFEARATRAGHLAGQSKPAIEDMAYHRDAPADPNGNTVTLEHEMLQAVSVKRQHSRALAVYQSALNIMRSSIAR